LRKFEVGVVGAGYVGLVTGACLAYLGHRVTVADRDPERIETLEGGRLPIHEPHLEGVIRDSAGRISFASSLERVVRRCEVLFVAVDTPRNEDGSADLSNVASLARDLGRVIASDPGRRTPLLVVNKSTVPVGSGDLVSMLIEEGSESAEGAGDGGARDYRDYRVVSNPEFLREGSAVHDTLYPDRIVLGSDSVEALETMRDLYGPIIERSFDPPEGAGRTETTDPVPFVTTDLASAEMVKYAANAFLATKISFINEISNICEMVGADVQSVARGIGLDGRIGSRFLEPGIGWGGSCFPKDVSVLRSTARDHGYTPSILDATVTVNEGQRELVVKKLQRALKTLEGRRVALLGLAFKPGTDDLRDAPSLYIARSLYSLGAEVVGYDPVAGENARHSLALRGIDLELAADPYSALTGAQAAVVVTEWEEVRCLDYARVAAVMEEPKVVVDGRNVLDPAEARSHGLRYSGFGRG
jgi:UDPglucose 6-dehydrogenase